MKVVVLCLLILFSCTSKSSPVEGLLGAVGCYMFETTTVEKSKYPLTFRGVSFPTYEEFFEAHEKFKRLDSLYIKLQVQTREGQPLDPKDQIDLITNLLRIASLSHKDALGILQTIFKSGLFGMPVNQDYAKAFNKAQNLTQWESAANALCSEHDFKRFAEELKERRGITMPLYEESRRDVPRRESASSEEFSTDTLNPLLATGLRHRTE